MKVDEVLVTTVLGEHSFVRYITVLVVHMHAVDGFRLGVHSPGRNAKLKLVVFMHSRSHRWVHNLSVKNDILLLVLPHV